MSNRADVLSVEAGDPTRVTVIQITDSHLLQDANGVVLGVPTREALRQVLSSIRQDYPHLRRCAPGQLSSSGRTGA